MHKPQTSIKATYMRGGTSKGVFFNVANLPADAQVPGRARDALCLRVIGSPDPYGKHIDGMGNASSSTSKCVLISKSSQEHHDVDYLFGQVAIDQPLVDWSGNCGNLSAAVGAFAIHAGLIDAARIPENGICTIRIWQANIRKTIVSHVPILSGQVQETGDFELDGVTFPAAEVVLEFIEPAEEGEGGAMFPTGNTQDQFHVPGFAPLSATFINAGIPTIFLSAQQLGLVGTELQPQINESPEWLKKFETLRAHGAMVMGLNQNLEQAASRQHIPKIAFVAPAQSYQASSGKQVAEQEIDFVVRALSMGKLHHAMMGTCAVAIATAAAIPGTIVNVAAGGGARESVRFGHPSGTLGVGAKAEFVEGVWQVQKAQMSRSARILMDGWIRVPL